jgi:Na+-driven multidrug efflux pump
LEPETLVNNIPIFSNISKFGCFAFKNCLTELPSMIVGEASTFVLAMSHDPTQLSVLAIINSFESALYDIGYTVSILGRNQIGKLMIKGKFEKAKQEFFKEEKFMVMISSIFMLISSLLYLVAILIEDSEAEFESLMKNSLVFAIPLFFFVPMAQFYTNFARFLGLHTLIYRYELLELFLILTMWIVTIPLKFGISGMAFCIFLTYCMACYVERFGILQKNWRKLVLEELSEMSSSVKESKRSSNRQQVEDYGLVVLTSNSLQ